MTMTMMPLAKETVTFARASAALRRDDAATSSEHERCEANTRL